MRKQDDKYGLPETLLLKAFPPTEIRELCNALGQQTGNVWLGNISAAANRAGFQAVTRQMDEATPSPRRDPVSG